MLHFVSSAVCDELKFKKLQASHTTLCENHYYVDTKQELSSDQLEQLKKILGDVREYSECPAPVKLVVTPRLGTISPWSSKATDILHVSGIENVTRIEKATVYYFVGDDLDQDTILARSELFYDRMTESVFTDVQAPKQLFLSQPSLQRDEVDVINNGKKAIADVNQQYGLALSEHDIDYLFDQYLQLKKNPTLTELMMFGQVNSEHCRHKIFNADWTLNGESQEKSLFAMIKNTYKNNSQGVLSAYHDNAAVIEGSEAPCFFWSAENKCYGYVNEPIHTVIKVETHNHPTAIEPFSGAATGAGGEIRDEGATGIGARPKAGLAGFSVSNLKIPGFLQPWEIDYGKPSHIASALDIMIKGPIGAASFNNEFGRPNLCGYFRSFEQTFDGAVRGYHKPIMIAGGLGNIRAGNVTKNKIKADMKLIVLGGPAMQIGLGGGAASSMQSGQSSQELDFASVQRSNPEMQRRVQQVINTCVAMGDNNPIVSIHDVGAGGLCNAMPELVNDSECGGKFELRDIPIAEQGMSPMAIWCNEAQERYVLAIDEQSLDLFTDIAARERCPFSVVGAALDQQHLTLSDQTSDHDVIDLPMSMLFHDAPKLHRQAQDNKLDQDEFYALDIDIYNAVYRVMRSPTVASKQFLITIGDRSVTGLVARDQMVGRWQVPVADVAVTANSYKAYSGEAMAMGERAPVALLDPQAAARIAVAEAITNIIASDIEQLSDIKLSANWMAATGDAHEEADLFAAVKAVGEEFCPALGLTIPVGKDSLSMRMKWQDNDQDKSVAAPLSLVISAFSRVGDVRKTLTPELKTDVDSELWLIDLGAGRNRLGGSILCQAFSELGAIPPDIDPQTMQNFFNAIKSFKDKILAYHDRSDGGLMATLCEMSFASHCGLDIYWLTDDPIRELFNEELGAVIQVDKKDVESLKETLANNNLVGQKVAVINDEDRINMFDDDVKMFAERRHSLQRAWSETSYKIQSLRDNPDCAKQEFDQLLDDKHAGLYSKLSFDCEQLEFPSVSLSRPKLAVLREQGVNGHMEMAAAFDAAGFECVDVHMTDIISGRVKLSEFKGLAACGGFSYGDVLGAGRGWANAILFNERAREEFQAFFHREDTFTLGVCNGCQMLSTIKELIPGAAHWPQFVKNKSRQFEARLLMSRIEPSPSILFNNMSGSEIPVVVAHGEGKVEHNNPGQLVKNQLVTMRYLTDSYPGNPNGSPLGITGLCSEDGRVNIMMPHPERIFRTVQFSWHPSDWQEYSPWMQMFLNARGWV